MTRNRTRVPMLLALAVFVMIPQSASAAAPRTNPGSMSIAGDPHGFTLRSERATQHGTVVDTFASADSTVVVVAMPGTKISFEPDIALPNGGHGFMIGSEETVAPTATATMANDLADLGVSASNIPPIATSLQIAPESQTGCNNCFTDGLPHIGTNSGICYNISLLGGDLAGTGCGTSYIDWKDPNNNLHWGLTSTYWLSITAYQYDLWGVYWRMQWPNGNQITSEAPSSSVYGPGQCGQDSYSVDVKVPYTDIGMGESYTYDACPTLYGPWNIKGISTALSSGAKWEGDVPPGTTMGVQGAQGVDDPSTASNHPVNSYYLIGYGIG